MALWRRQCSLSCKITFEADTVALPRCKLLSISDAGLLHYDMAMKACARNISIARKPAALREAIEMHQSI